MHADSTSTSELLFAYFSERALVQNVSHENDLIFMPMNLEVTNTSIPIVLHKDPFCHRGKSKHGIWLFIHELAQGAFDFFLVQSQIAVWFLECIRHLRMRMAHRIYRSCRFEKLAWIP